jgi:hypothetical protein
MGAAVGTIIFVIIGIANNYRMHNGLIWSWLAEAMRALYAEVIPGYATSVQCCDNEPEAACVCSECIYLPLMILLEEYLEGDENIQM